MYTVTQQIRFCFGHRLLRYEGKCRNLHGHSARVEVDIQSPDLDPRGMVADVCAVEEKLQTWIDTHLDHKLLLAEGDPLLPALKASKEPYFVMAGNPTMENLCRLIFDGTRGSGNDRFDIINKIPFLF